MIRPRSNIYDVIITKRNEKRWLMRLTKQIDNNILHNTIEMSSLGYELIKFWRVVDKKER